MLERICRLLVTASDCEPDQKHLQINLDSQQNNTSGVILNWFPE